MSTKKINAPPEKSKETYQRYYNEFSKWLSDKNIATITEDVLLSYFKELNQSITPSTCWNRYSMLKVMLFNNNHINIDSFNNLKEFLKINVAANKALATNTLTKEEIIKFLNEAPNCDFLPIKAIVVVELSGACTADELFDLTMDNITVKNDSAVIAYHTRNDECKTFTITGDFFLIFKKYVDLRPVTAKSNKLWINFCKNRCYDRFIGIHRIRNVPKEIAKFLQLPFPDSFSGYSSNLFSKTESPVLFVDRADKRRVEIISEWYTGSVTEDCINDTETNMRDQYNTENISLLSSSPTSEMDNVKDDAEYNIYYGIEDESFSATDIYMTDDQLINNISLHMECSVEPLEESQKQDHANYLKERNEAIPYIDTLKLSQRDKTMANKFITVYTTNSLKNILSKRKTAFSSSKQNLPETSKRPASNAISDVPEKRNKVVKTANEAAKTANNNSFEVATLLVPRLNLNDFDGIYYKPKSQLYNFVCEKLAAQKAKSFDISNANIPLLFNVIYPLEQKILKDERKDMDDFVKSLIVKFEDKTTMIQWIADRGLILNNPMIKCALHPMNRFQKVQEEIVKSSQSLFFVAKCCPSRKLSIYYNSIFMALQHHPMILFKLLYHWICNSSYKNIMSWMKIKEGTIVQAYEYFRVVCACANIMVPFKYDNIEVGVVTINLTLQYNTTVSFDVLGMRNARHNFLKLIVYEVNPDSEMTRMERHEAILKHLNNYIPINTSMYTDESISYNFLRRLGYKNLLPRPRNNLTSLVTFLTNILPPLFQQCSSGVKRCYFQQVVEELCWRYRYRNQKKTLLDLYNQMIADIANITTPNNPDEGPLPIRLLVIAHDMQSSTIKKFCDRVRNIKNAIISNCFGSFGDKHSYLGSPNTKGLVNTVPINDLFFGESTTPLNKLTSHQRSLMTKAFKINITCHHCNFTMTSTELILKHFIYHIFGSVKVLIHICSLCPAMLPTEKSLNLHNKTHHEYRDRFCILCEKSFDTLENFKTHVVYDHCQRETPYKCPVCEYASCSHKVTVSHFFQNHSETGILLCSFCMTMFIYIDDNGVNDQMIKSYYAHLEEHTKTKYPCRFNCALKFLSLRSMLTHCVKDHLSKSKISNLPIELPVIFYIKKKEFSGRVRTMQSDDCKTVINLLHKSLELSNKNNTLIPTGISEIVCLECKNYFDAQHFTNVVECECGYFTKCKYSILNHKCYSNKPTSVLPHAMYCYCGFSTLDGFSLADHLVSCGVTSAYTSKKQADKNILQETMLSMIGLVKNTQHIKEANDLNSSFFSEKNIENTVESFDDLIQ